MKLKIFILFFIVLSLISAPVWALDTRKAVLNGTAVGNNDPAGLVLDSSDSFVNPAYISYYGNLVGVESWALPYRTAGFVFLDLGSIGSFGIQLGRNFGMKKANTLQTGQDIDDLEPIYMPVGFQEDLGSDNANINNLNNVISLGIIYGLPLGNTLKLGIAFNYIGNSVEGNVSGDPQTPDVRTFKESLKDMEFRVGTEINLEIIKIAFDAGIGLPSYSYSLSIDNEQAEFSPMNLDFNLRLAFAIKKDIDGVFRFTYAGFGGELYLDPDTAIPLDGSTRNLTRNDISVFAGALFKGKKGVFGLELGFENVAYASETNVEVSVSDTSMNNPSTISFPIIRILGERDIAEWLTLLGSIKYEWVKITTEQNSSTAITTTDWETESLSTSTLEIALGYIFTFEKITIEGYVNQLIFDTLSTGAPLNFGISLGYKF